MARYFNLRIIKQFLGPWLVFSVLSGLGSAFILGALATVLGLVTGIYVLATGIDNLSKAATEIAHAFPLFALIVLGAIIFGFLGGFFTGLIFALVGGQADYWWGFLLFWGVGIMLNTEAIFPSIAMIIVGYFGAQFPQSYLRNMPLRHEKEKPLQEWLCNSWLANPSQFARIVAIFLPITVYGILEFYF